MIQFQREKHCCILTGRRHPAMVKEKPLVRRWDGLCRIGVAPLYAQREPVECKKSKSNLLAGVLRCLLFCSTLDWYDATMQSGYILDTSKVVMNLCRISKFKNLEVTTEIAEVAEVSTRRTCIR